MGLVQVATFATRIEAELARLNLEVAGLDAILFDAEMNTGLGAMMPVRLMVLEQEFDEAAAVLNDEGLL